LRAVIVDGPRLGTASRGRYNDGIPLEDRMGHEVEKTAAANDAAGGAARRGTKRAYSRPTLIEYGSVAKLTQGTLTRQSDAPTAGFKMTQTCL
jgi:hypothetical protein